MLAAGCSGDSDSSDGASGDALAGASSTVPPLDSDISTIPFDEFGRPELPTGETLLPNTPIVNGEQVTLTGTFVSTVTLDADTGIELDCHYVVTDDDVRVNAAFDDVYIADGTAYLGPADYDGDPDEYAFDPVLTGPGSRILVQGEATSIDGDICASDSDHPGTTVIVLGWSPS